MKKKQKNPLSYVSLYQIVPETKPHIFIKMCLPVAVTTWLELQRTKKKWSSVDFSSLCIIL